MAPPNPITLSLRLLVAIPERFSKYLDSNIGLNHHIRYIFNIGWRGKRYIINKLSVPGANIESTLAKNNYEMAEKNLTGI